MRGGRAAIGTSLVVHLAVIAAVRGGAPDEPALPSRDPAAIAALEPLPIEVTFLAEPPSTATASGSDASRSERSHGAAPVVRHASTGGTNASASERAVPGEGAPHSPYMTMRSPRQQLGVGLSDAWVDDYLAHSRPVPPPPDIPGERVGNEIAELRSQLAHTDRYSPDEIRGLRETLVARLDERAAEEIKPDGHGTYRTTKETFDAKIRSDGTVALTDHIGGMDQFMKDHGADPYQANKLRYLDRTRDQRAAVGARFREQELAKSVVYMQGHIARLWSMTSDVQERKRGLFELWDDCAETGSPAEIAGGAAARAFVMSHIRATVTYSADELRALNAQRHSSEAFAP